MMSGYDFIFSFQLKPKRHIKPYITILLPGHSNWMTSNPILTWSGLNLTFL